MMAMIFIDDPYYPYKTCFLLATVLSNTPSPLFFFLTYSTSTATFNSRWIQAFHLFSCFKKKSLKLKLKDEIITFLTVPLTKVYVAWNFMGKKCLTKILNSKRNESIS